MTEINADQKKIEMILSHNAEEVIIKDELKKKLGSGKKLRIKLGCDPSRPDLHLGHSVVLRKLKEFQDLGHQVVFIIGDYTGMIGDPSGKSKTRPALSRSEVSANAKSYFSQVGKILDTKKTEIHFNSEWFSKMSFEDVLKLTAKFTIARILERDEFSNRLKSGSDIAVHEIMYPIMQAYDSIAIDADVEIGGTDQKFNMLAGRDLQRKMGKPEQNVLTCPLLVGLDGKEKMSKSLDNYIGISEKPDSMFGKIMSISDPMISYYFKLLTDISEDDLKKIEADLKDPSKNPKNLKVALAKEIITIYHGKDEAEKAENEFNKIFRDKQKPTEMEEKILKSGTYKIVDLLPVLGFTDTKSSAKIIIQQGGMKIDDDIQKDWNKTIDAQDGDRRVIQVGKKRFIRVIFKR